MQPPSTPMYEFCGSICDPVAYDNRMEIWTDHLGYTSVCSGKARKRAKDNAISSYNNFMNPQWRCVPPDPLLPCPSDLELEPDIQLLQVADYAELNDTFGPLSDFKASELTTIPKFEDYEYVSFCCLLLMFRCVYLIVIFVLLIEQSFLRCV